MRGHLFLGAATAALLMFAPTAMAQDADPPGDNSTQVQFTGAAIDGAISPAGDVDRYRMRVEQGQRYSFTVDGVPNADGVALDPMISIYSQDGNQLAFNDDANGTLNSAVQWSPTMTGDVYIEVSAYSSEGQGAYRLAATAATNPPDAVGNDASTNARISVGGSVNGELEYEGDGDWYRLNVRTGQRYRISLSGNTSAANPLGDPYLRVLSRSGEELAVNDDFESLDSQLEFVPTTSGQVFVEARGYADAYTGAYTLSVADERLPTDNFAADRYTRGRLAIGASTDGTLDFAGDRDWYRLRLEEGQSYRFTLAGAGGEAVGDPLLRLYDANGVELAMDDDSGGNLSSYLEYTAPSTGTYFIEARGFADEATGGYQLAARAGDIPGDNSTDVTLSADNGDYRMGNLAPAGDRDWYRVDLTEGQGMRVGLNSGEGADALGDPYIVIYGPDGAEVARDDDGGEGLNSWLEYQASAAGPHYVEVRGFVEDASGRYALTLTPGEVGNQPDGTEYVLPNGEGRTAQIGAIGDVDWFAVEMIEGRPYRFNVMGGDGADGSLVDPYLRLYDSEGTEIRADDDGGWGLNSYLTYVSVTGGTYFAAVSSFGDTGTGRYWLQVTDTDVPGHEYTDENLDGTADDRVSRIDMPGDLDNYRVELEGGVRYVIEVRGQGDEPLTDAFVAVVDQSNTRLATDDDSGDGLDARLRFTPETSGTYMIQASGLGGSIGWYQISIVRQ